MVLTRLARWAGMRPHVLLAVTPGATRVRLAAEAELTRIGAVAAQSPADADVLLVAGAPGGELAGAIDEVWRQMPGPRARLQILEPGETVDALQRAVDELSADRQEADRRDEWAEAGAEREGGHGSGQHGRSGHGSHDDGGEHEQHDDAGPHEQHGGNDGHGGGMQMPGGLMMADRGPDRDGLKLDVLQVPLGPVLSDWPGGLIAELTLQGDVVQQVGCRVLPAAIVTAAPFWQCAGEDASRHVAASHLDSLGRLLAVAGWPAMAYRVRRLRDAVLTGMPVDRARRELATVGRRLRRSAALRWATGGLGVLTAGTAERLGVSGPAGRAVADGGDVYARWRRWLAEADRLLAGEGFDEPGPRGVPRVGRPASVALLAAAEELMVGLDVAAARLVLASFDPDPDEVVPSPAPVGAGS